MEFIVCMLLASLLTGGRVATDIVYGLRGATPPHVEKARLKAQRAQAAAKTSKGGRSPYAEGKPRLRDVAAVYWGDALTDVIDDHNRHREAKKNPPPAPAHRPDAKGPSLLKRIRDLALNPVGEPIPTDPPVTQPAPEKVPTWECTGCGLDFTGDGPEPGRCVPCSGTATPQPPTTPPASSRRRDGRNPHTVHNTATNGGPTMSQPTSTPSGAGSATGDCHDVESAIVQCNALDDDLTAINTALDLIDEKIHSAGNAAEGIEAFLASKNVDDAAVGGMSVARDMLSPTHIKALMDAIAAAKQGVAHAHAELSRLQDVEQQLNGADGSVLNGR